MCLHRVLADEQTFGDFAVAEARGHCLQNLELTRCDAELREFRLIPLEWSDDRYFYMYRNFLNDDCLFRTRQFAAEPDAEHREHQGDDAAVDLERMFDDEKSVLDDLEQGDEKPAQDAVDEDGFLQREKLTAADPGGTPPWEAQIVATPWAVPVTVPSAATVAMSAGTTVQVTTPGANCLPY